MNIEHPTPNVECRIGKTILFASLLIAVGFPLALNAIIGRTLPQAVSLGAEPLAPRIKQPASPQAGLRLLQQQGQLQARMIDDQAVVYLPTFASQVWVHQGGETILINIAATTGKP